MCNKNMDIYSCEDIKFITIDECSNSSHGSCLIVPVYIHNVCKNKTLLVIIEVYKNNRLYAREIKKISTSCNKTSCCTCKNKNCCCDNNIIDSVFVGNFEFYFIDDCNPKCVYVDIKTQYIYDC